MKAKAVIFSIACNALLIGAFSASAQTGLGVLNFSNVGASDDRKIWASYNNGSGVFAAGTSYRIALYWGQQGTPEVALTQVGTSVGFLTGVNAGLFFAGNRTLSGLSQNGAVVTVQARGWVTIPGIPDTYEAVLAAGLAGNPNAQIGKGPVFDHDTARPNDPTDPPRSIGAPVAVGGNPGWCGFVIGYPETPGWGVPCIPEPSTLALAFVGASALLLTTGRSKLRRSVQTRLNSTRMV